MGQHYYIELSYMFVDLDKLVYHRAIAIANYIIDHNATVRQTARRFGISKSTVHTEVIN